MILNYVLTLQIKKKLLINFDFCLTQVCYNTEGL